VQMTIYIKIRRIRAPMRSPLISRIGIVNG
jgi:hypothetical protein